MLLERGGGGVSCCDTHANLSGCKMPWYLLSMIKFVATMYTSLYLSAAGEETSSTSTTNCRIPVIINWQLNFHVIAAFGGLVDASSAVPVG